MIKNYNMIKTNKLKLAKNVKTIRNVKENGKL